MRSSFTEDAELCCECMNLMDIKAGRLHVPSHANGQDSAQSGVVPRRQGPWVPSTNWGLWGPFPWCNTHAGKRVPFGHEWQLGRSLFGMPARVPVVPIVAWSVLGSPPFSTFHHCTEQVATDPQSPKGGSQRACPLGVPTPRLLGVSQEWRCFSSRPCFRAAVRSRLFGLPAQEF